MNEIQKFANVELGADIRVIDRDGEPWFVATDIAKVLGYRDARDATRWLDDDEKDTHLVRTLGGNQDMIVVSESGLYSLVVRSERPEAKPFRKWVTAEVLPSIRRTGRYEIPGLGGMLTKENMLAMARTLISENARADAEKERADAFEAGWNVFGPKKP